MNEKVGMNKMLLIKGAGDLATGVAWRLWQCGYDLVMTETEQPTTVRCSVAFSRAVYEGTATVEGLTARRCADEEEARAALAAGMVPVVADPEATIRHALRPDALIDAVIAKRNIGTAITDAPVVIALGPGYTAGVDCHAVVETLRGHDLGRVYYSGSAAPNTGSPGEVAGYTTERILRAPCAGVFRPAARIGGQVRAGDTVGYVGQEPVLARLDGMIRGLLPDGTPVEAGMKAGDVDPRGSLAGYTTISDKARAVGGGVLEALLHLTGGRRL